MPTAATCGSSGNEHRDHARRRACPSAFQLEVVQNSPQGPRLGSGGAYLDEMVRKDGRWLFRYRKIDRFIAT